MALGDHLAIAKWRLLKSRRRRFLDVVPINRMTTCTQRMFRPQHLKDDTQRTTCTHRPQHSKDDSINRQYAHGDGHTNY